MDRIVKEEGSVNPCKSVSKVTSVVKEPTAPVTVVSEPVDKSRAHYKDGRNVRIGDRVIRGPDWVWGDSDGGVGGMGTVERFNKSCKLHLLVKWDNKLKLVYKMGADHYDLQLAP